MLCSGSYVVGTWQSSQLYGCIFSPLSVVTIPYINNMSESIRRILKDLNITTHFRPHQTLRNILVNAKDRVPPETRTGVVYSILCGDCTATYVGQTKIIYHTSFEGTQESSNHLQCSSFCYS